LKDKLKLDHEIKIFVTVNNRTFPRHSDDLVRRYNESYAVYNKNYKPNETLINGNFTSIDDVYNIRKHLLQNKADLLRNSLSSINSQFATLPMFQKHLESGTGSTKTKSSYTPDFSQKKNIPILRNRAESNSDSDLDDFDSI
jgi:hypothetical protein